MRSNVVSVHAAVASGDGYCRLEDGSPDFWGLRYVVASDSSSGDIKALSVPTLLDQVGGRLVFAKIDIEGGETELFSRNTSWLDDCSALAVELHDWMLPFKRSSGTFWQALEGRSFECLISGENLFFLFNPRPPS